MTSRAREKLFLLREQGANNPLMNSLLPDDPTILAKHTSWNTN